MSLVRQLLIDKELFDAQEEVDKLLEENGITNEFVVQKLEFDKSVFNDTDQVNDFLQAHLFTSLQIEDEDKVYGATIFAPIALVPDTVKKVKIREGVVVVVGILRDMSADNPALFTDVTKDTIKFSADVPHVIMLARTVKGFHVNFGEVELTKEDLISFHENFSNNVVGVDITIDFDHEVREAAGWLKETFLSDDSEVLFGVVKWTPKGALSLSDREFRYYSPEFHRNWVHPHTQQSHGPTLLGGALVNRPFLKMDAIVGLKDKHKQGALEVDTIALSEHKAKVAGFENEIKDLKLSELTAKNKAADLEKQNTALSEEVKTLKAEKEKREKEAEHNRLFSENKINKAQLDALNEGKTMLEVLSLSEGMNTKPAGGEGGSGSTGVQLSETEKAYCKKHGWTEEEFLKYNPRAGA